MCDSDDRVVEHLAGIEDYLLAIATYQAARRRWPDAHVKLTRLTCPNHLRPRHNRGPGIANVASQENLPERIGGSISHAPRLDSTTIAFDNRIRSNLWTHEPTLT